MKNALETRRRLTTHSTRAQIELLSCARPHSYYGLSRRVNSGVRRFVVFDRAHIDRSKSKQMISKSFSDTLRKLLYEKKKPMAISTLIKLALPIERAKRRNAAECSVFEVYEVAKSEESPFIIEECPSFKLRSFTKLPQLPISRYLPAAFKILLSSGEYVELREIVRRALEQRMLKGITTRHPDIQMYWNLKKYPKVFSERGTFKIGLKEWHVAKDYSRKQISRERVLPVTVENITPNIHEANLESLLIERLEVIEEGLQLIKRQYVCSGIGRIDILCKDRKGNLVVIELKKFGVRHDSIIDQIARYMGYVKAHIAKGNQKVRGIIVVGKVDERLHYAVSAFPSIEVKTFNLTIS